MISKLILGTAQLGLNYGITNKHGKPYFEDSQNLVQLAINKGVLILDTARTYGESEEIIGYAIPNSIRHSITVITKLSHLSELSEKASKEEVNYQVDFSIAQSIHALQTDKIDVLLIHRFSHLSDWSGQVWKRLIYHRNTGKIKSIGVSVQSPEELLTSLNYPEVEHLQLPFNLLDSRWDDVTPQIVAVKASRKLIIHARSIFLQGLLLSQEPSYWKRANILVPEPIWKWLAQKKMQCNRISLKDLCISYVAAIPWIDGMVIGVENTAQLLENISLLKKPSLNIFETNLIKATRPNLDSQSLNPAHWKDN